MNNIDAREILIDFLNQVIGHGMLKSVDDVMRVKAAIDVLSSNETVSDGSN